MPNTAAVSISSAGCRWIAKAPETREVLRVKAACLAVHHICNFYKDRILCAKTDDVMMLTPGIQNVNDAALPILGMKSRSSTESFANDPSAIILFILDALMDDMISDMIQNSAKMTGTIAVKAAAAAKGLPDGLSS